MMSPGSSRTMKKMMIEIPTSVGIMRQNPLSDEAPHGRLKRARAGPERRPARRSRSSATVTS